MDRKKERYLVTLRAGIKGTGVLEEIDITRNLITKGKRKGFSFTFEWTKTFTEADKYDGYQIFVTTEFDLSEKEVIESYRTRDQIEKAMVMSRKNKFEGQDFTSFCGGFMVNFCIPDYLGVGKSVSKGYGTVREFDAVNENI